MSVKKVEAKQRFVFSLDNVMNEIYDYIVQLYNFIYLLRFPLIIKNFAFSFNPLVYNSFAIRRMIIFLNFFFYLTHLLRTLQLCCCNYPSRIISNNFHQKDGSINANVQR